jgi:acetylornithine/succinyldiaminopimelate/putrescine aminotransferase
MDVQKPGSMGGTYGGNAVACAAAVAVAKAFQEEKILENVNARGEELTSMLKAAQDDPKTGKMIYDVRGLGLMLALECRAREGICIEDSGQVYGEGYASVDDVNLRHTAIHSSAEYHEGRHGRGMSDYSGSYQRSCCRREFIGNETKDESLE